MLLLTEALMLRARVSNDHERLIRPRLVSDGRYACSALTLTDPAHAHVLSALAEGEIDNSFSGSFATTGLGEVLIVDGKQVVIIADDNEWSIQASGTGHRFELRQGYVGLEEDGTDKQRSEIVSYSTKFAAGAEVWQSWSTSIEVVDGFTLIADQNYAIINQWHSVDPPDAVGRSPVLAFDYGNNAFRIVTRSSAALSNGNGVEQVRFSDALPSGVVHYVCRFRLGQAGELQVWRNGSEIVNITVPIGYYNDGGDLGYPQWGIYRKSGPSPLAVKISNMRWGTTNLSAKISSPDAVA